MGKVYLFDVAISSMRSSIRVHHIVLVQLDILVL